MAGIQQVSFTNPYSSEEADIARRRQMAEMLQQKGQEGLGPTEMVGGWAIPKSPWEGLSKAAQSISGAYQQEQANEKQKALTERYQGDYQKMVAKGLRELQGSPAQANAAVDDPAAGQYAPASQTPAQAPDPMAALATFGSHPQGAALAPMAMQQIQRQQMIQALRGGAQAPQAAPQGGMPQGSQGAAPGAPTGGQPAGVGGPAAGIPMEMYLQTDPSGKSYLEALAKDNLERGKPVVNRGYGIGTMNAQGQYVPDQASVGQARQVEEMKAGIHAGFAPPVAIPMSGGQSASVFPPEFAGVRQTGQPPARIGGQSPIPQAPQGVPVPQAQGPLPQGPVASGGPMPRGLRENPVTAGNDALFKLNGEAKKYTDLGQPVPQDLAAEIAKAQTLASGRYPKSANPTPQREGLGTLGLTQPQDEQIRQARETAAGKEVDQTFAKDYVAFSTGGAQDAQKQIAQLTDVTKALNDPNAKLTGPFIGGMPDMALKFNKTGRNAIAMRERVEEVVQRSLRAVLGAQFTEKEGERLIARAYNPNLSEKENAIRVGRLTTQLQQALASKQDAAQYFEKNGTLSGWKGKMPSMADFDPDAQSAGGKIGKPQVSKATRDFLKQQGITVD